ncbi:MAG: glycosyltransferase family 39 protein [Anaerolineae bacterium]|nr:glycosyltransferase family 39 protein [Anaerolineae bacterium]
MSQSTSQPIRASVFVPALVILIGLLLRIAMLGVDMRFHPDEALFAAQARLISHDGAWLLRDTNLDKPPLTLFVTASAFRALEPSEFAARLPNMLCSGMNIAVFYALAYALYRDRTVAWLAALLLALSPYDLAFAATVFTDIQATLWVLIACWLTVRDRWAWAGAAAAVMFATKSTALLALPLILALGIAHNAHRTWTPRDVLRRLAAFAGPLATGIALLVLWDLGRAPRSFLDLGYQRNNPGRLIRSDELLPRLEQWEHWLGFITGSRVVTMGLLALIPTWLITRVAAGLPLPQRRGVALPRPGRDSVKKGRSRTAPLRKRERSALEPQEEKEYRDARAITIDWLIGGYSLAFLGWYWLVAFNTYDRYLHPLIPLLMLLVARALIGFWRWIGAHRVTLVIATALLILLMLPGMITVLRGDAAIAGDQGQHTGINTLADYLNTALAGETVYDHWLGWELAYYLGPTPQVHLRYVAQPEALPEDYAAHPTPPRYFVVPSPDHAAHWLAALHHTGISTTRVYFDETHGFVVYQLNATNYN